MTLQEQERRLEIVRRRKEVILARSLNRVDLVINLLAIIAFVSGYFVADKTPFVVFGFYLLVVVAILRHARRKIVPLYWEEK
jgi:Fe2+ transport system protein B